MMNFVYSFPAGTNRFEVQQSCPLPFPVLATDREYTLFNQTLSDEVHRC